MSFDITLSIGSQLLSIESGRVEDVNEDRSSSFGGVPQSFQ